MVLSNIGEQLVVDVGDERPRRVNARDQLWNDLRHKGI